MSLVDRIQSLCSSENTTLISLERKLGFGRGTIRKWDENSPSIDKIQKVADYFKIPTDYLLGRSTYSQRPVLTAGDYADGYTDEPTLFEEMEDELRAAIYDLLGSYNISNGQFSQEIQHAIKQESELLRNWIDTTFEYNPQGILQVCKEVEDTEFISEMIKMLKQVKQKITSSNINTIAANHNGEDWTEEELKSIEEFKEFVKSKRNKK